MYLTQITANLLLFGIDKKVIRLVRLFSEAAVMGALIDVEGVALASITFVINVIKTTSTVVSIGTVKRASVGVGVEGAVSPAKSVATDGLVADVV